MHPVPVAPPNPPGRHTDAVIAAGAASAAAAAWPALAERLAPLYARLALGAAFLSAVASRLGLWSGQSVATSFARFTRYTAEVNSFMPAATIPFLAWAATAAELSLGVALVLGLWPRRAALASALLLFLFGTAMAISSGIKEPLDYSVFSASAGALLLALHRAPGSGGGRRARAGNAA